MRISKLVLIVSFAALAGCVHNQAKDKSAAAEPQKQQKNKEAAKEQAPNLAVTGTPAAGSKFAKLKPGMTMKQVVALIGQPDNQWRRPTGKSSIPFYFGDDRWVLECVYKKEGKLTFNAGGDQLLTGVEVNKGE